MWFCARFCARFRADLRVLLRKRRIIEKCTVGGILKLYEFVFIVQIFHAGIFFGKITIFFLSGKRLGGQCMNFS